MSKVHREARIYFTVGLLFFLDQALKWLASAGTSNTFDIIPNVIKFKIFLNDGLIFSVPVPNIFIVIFSILILALLLFLIIRSDRADNEPAVWHYSLIFAGGLSNIVDRLYQGATIDYLNIVPFNFPVFNMADVMVAVGLILLVFSWARKNRQPTG
ncbi:signal peptidase II [Patescibacteria group bacterium]